MVALLKRFIPVVDLYSIGDDSLACPGVSSKGEISRTIGETTGAGFNPPPAHPVLDPPPLEAVSDATDYDADALVVLAILF